MSDNNSNVPVSMIYAGRIIDEKGKIFHGWVPDDDHDAKPNWWSKLPGSLKAAYLSIGSVYELQMSENRSTMNMGIARYLSTYRDDPAWTSRIEEWETQDRLSVDSKTWRDKAKKAKRLDPMKEMMAPLRKLYHRTPHISRRLVMASFLELLTRAPSQAELEEWKS